MEKKRHYAAPSLEVVELVLPRSLLAGSSLNDTSIEGVNTENVPEEW